MRDWQNEPENTLRDFVRYLDRELVGTSLVYFSDNERESVEAVDVVLNIAIRTLEENAKSHSRLGELALSTMLTDLISRSAVPCQKEGYRNGHVDIIVGHPRLKHFQYLGECKIYKGFRHHCSGCEQLLNRYSTGRDMRGFLLEFFNRSDMYKLLQTLKTKFDTVFPLEMKAPSKEHGHIKGAFVSLHSHFTSTDVEVLHLGCNLYQLRNGRSNPKSKKKERPPRKRA
jgi:hypothetical protein